MNGSARRGFPILDGIRGIAALFVVVRHTPEFWTYHFYRSYIAVDLFFVLSGFVIAYAYEARLQSGAMSAKQFVVARLIRFYPMYAFAMVFSLAVICLRLRYAPPAAPHDSLAVAVRSFVTELFFVPTPSLPKVSVFHTVPVAWTLAWELAVNIAFAFLRPALTNRRLAISVALLAVAMVVVARKFGSLNAGYLWTLSDLFAGGIRSFFGIFLGVLLHRYREAMPATPRLASHPVVLLALLSAALATPWVLGWNAFIDLAYVFVLFPLCILLGARQARWAGDNVLVMLGNLSYPIYLLHPAFGLAGFLLAADWAAGAAPYSGLLMTAALCGVVWAVERWFDLPLRKRISKALLARSN